MARSNDLLTRRTRDAANAAAAAVVIFAWLFFLTTQIGPVRAVSPFGEDPYDLAASFAVILLPIVAGATLVRSLAHRGARLPVRIARRIVIGSAIAVAIIGVALVADVAAMLETPGWVAAAGAIGAVIVALVAATTVVAIGAAAVLERAIVAVRSPASVAFDTGLEPDVVDDALALAAEVVDWARFARLRRAVIAANRFFERSPFSPRRHRALFGLVLAAASAVAFIVWHAFREGPWASPAAALTFGSLPAAGILAIYLATLAPLRLLRPPR